MGEFGRVTGTTDVQPGQGIIAEVNGKTLAVFNVDGAFHAIDNTCIHRGGPLGEGDLEGSVVTCPWHGWQYDVTTGACVANPTAKVERYEVQVEGTDVKVLL
jgi:3-phenylpropionate/trans-cinnamate dioxygenase ferredoxin component